MNDLQYPEPAWQFNELDNAVDYLEMVSYFFEEIHTPWKWKWIAISLHQALYTFMISALAGTDPAHSVIERDITNNPNSHNARVGAAHALWSEGKTIQEIATELENTAKVIKADALRKKKKTEQEIAKELENATHLKVTPKSVEKLLREKPFVISFEKALMLIQRTDELPKNNINPLQLTKVETKQIARLKDNIRNEFEHFTPRTWIMMDLQYFSQVVRPVLRVIHFIALESNYIYYLEDDERPARIKQVVERIVKYPL
jgi:hypothetical protein